MKTEKQIRKYLEERSLALPDNIRWFSFSNRTETQIETLKWVLEIE
jgi:hypothetical protein